MLKRRPGTMGLKIWPKNRGRWGMGVGNLGHVSHKAFHFATVNMLFSFKYTTVLFFMSLVTLIYASVGSLLRRIRSKTTGLSVTLASFGMMFLTIAPFLWMLCTKLRTVWANAAIEKQITCMCTNWEVLNLWNWKTPVLKKKKKGWYC